MFTAKMPLGDLKLRFVISLEKMKPLAILSISVSEEEPTSVSFAAKEHTSDCLSVRLVKSFGLDDPSRPQDGLERKRLVFVLGEYDPCKAFTGLGNGWMKRVLVERINVLWKRSLIGGIQTGRLRGELLQTSLFHFTPITFRAICTSKALNRIGFGRP